MFRTRRPRASSACSGFVIATMTAQLAHLGVQDESPVFWVGAVFGGVVQVTAGMLSYFVGDNFHFIVYNAFGWYWIVVPGFLLGEELGFFEVTSTARGLFSLTFAILALAFAPAGAVHNSVLPVRARTVVSDDAHVAAGEVKPTGIVCATHRLERMKAEAKRAARKRRVELGLPRPRAGGLRRERHRPRADRRHRDRRRFRRSRRDRPDRRPQGDRRRHLSASSRCGCWPSRCARSGSITRPKACWRRDAEGAANKWGRRAAEWGQALVFIALGLIAASVALGARPDAEKAAEARQPQRAVARRRSAPARDRRDRRRRRRRDLHRHGRAPQLREQDRDPPARQRARASRSSASWDSSRRAWRS